MNRKLSCRQKSISTRSIVQVRLVSRSNKKILSKPSERKQSKSEYESIRKIYSRKISRQRIERKTSACQSVKQRQCHLPPIQLQQLINLPAFKKFDSQSTAQDFSEKIKKQQIKQLKPIKVRNRKMMSFLFAQARQNSQQTSIQKQQKQQKQYPTINYENQYQRLQIPKRKVLQCKIIRNAKIPFPIQRVTNQKQRKFEQFQAEMEQISEIKIVAVSDFISPQSKFLIDF